MAWETNQTVAFEKHFTKSSDGSCWEWTGNTFLRGGYGAFTHRPSGTTMQRAHRIAWTIYCGLIPDGLHVLHKCDNRLCVNPDHLFLGDHADNMADRDFKHRQNRGESHGMRKLTEVQAAEVLAATGPQAEIAARFGISVPTVCDIKRGYSWKHLPRG